MWLRQGRGYRSTVACGEVQVQPAAQQSVSVLEPASRAGFAWRRCLSLLAASVQTTCPLSRPGPLRTASRCEVPLRFAGGCLWAVHGAAGVHRCGIVRCVEWWWGCWELRLRSTPRYRLVCSWFHAFSIGLPVWTWQTWTRSLDHQPGVKVQGA